MLAALGVVFSPRSESPPTPTDLAYRICGACGFDVAEVEKLIDNMRYSTLSREQNLELFRSTFERREDAELCIGCAEASWMLRVGDGALGRTGTPVRRSNTCARYAFLA